MNLLIKGKPGKMKRQKNRLKSGERSDAYLTQICRFPRSIARASVERTDRKLERSASTVDFISCRSRLTIILTCVARGSGEKGSGLM